MTRVAALLVWVGIGAALASPAVRAEAPRQVSPQSAASQEDVERLRAYQTLFATGLAGVPSQTSLARLLRSTFSLAGTRSTAADGRAENRAALVALMFYVNRWPVAVLTPEARSWPIAARRTITLGGRHDLAGHFVASAAIAAAAGEPIAALAGAYKELRDARVGSGFSFSDLAADRAGTAFGALATRDTASARQLQAFVADNVVEADFMPRTTGLVDGMTERQFVSRFGAVGSPQYNEMLLEIDARISSLAVYK